MSRYVTTSLRFEAAIYAELKLRARREGVPLARVVREAVEIYLGRAEGAGVAPGVDSTDALVGCVVVATSDEAAGHDIALYGWAP